MNNELTPEFMADMLHAIMTDDPVKVFEAIDDYKMIVEADAVMGSTREQLMAEYAMYAFTHSDQTAPTARAWAEYIEANDDAVTDALAERIKASGW